MISRRNGRFRAQVFAAAAAALLGACSTSDSTRPLRGAGSLKDKDGDACPGKSGGVCMMSARVLLDKAGNAILEIRPGSFNNATNTGLPDGYIDKVHYKILGSDGKKISDKKGWEMNVKVPDTQFFTTALPFPFDPTNTVDLEVNIENQSGKKGESVVHGNALVLSNPNINLVAVGIQLHRPSPSTAVLSLSGPTIVAIQTGVAGHYTVSLFNDYIGGVAPAVGIQTRCVVLVDGVVPTTGISFPNGQSFFVAPLQAQTCAFDLTLTAIGAHTITVRADAIYPADFDPSDNSVSGSVTVTEGETLDTGGAAPGAVKEAIWYVGPAASGQVYGLTKQDASVTSLSALIVNGDGDLGSFGLTATMKSGGALFETVTMSFDHLMANSCQDQSIGNAGFVNNAIVQVELCAVASQAADGSPAQAITLSYSSAIFSIPWSDPSVPHALFGASVDFNFHISRTVNGVLVKSLEAPVSITVAPAIPNPAPTAYPPEWGTLTGVVRINAGA